MSTTLSTTHSTTQSTTQSTPQTPTADSTEALVIHAKGDLRLDRVPIAQPGPGEVLVRVAWGAICGSDMHYLQHGGVGASVLREPMILGHEISGFVERVGAGADFTPGEPVAVHPAHPCGACPECQRGARHLCRSMRFLGSAALLPHTGGGFRRLMTVPAAQVFPLPAGLAVQNASIAEPLSVALHAVSRAGEIAGKRVLVQGAGPIGALTIAALKVAGAAHIVATDLQDFPLEVATRMGATATVNTAVAKNDDEYDIVFEATGVVGALPSAIASTMKGGILVQVGMFPPGMISVPLGQIIARELDYRGSFRFDHEFGHALKLLAENPWIAEGMVTHKFKLDQFDKAFSTSLDRRESSKVLISITE